VLDDEGEAVYGVWMIPQDGPDVPVIVSQGETDDPRTSSQPFGDV
jgi:hypothetical protein